MNNENITFEELVNAIENCSDENELRALLIKTKCFTPNLGVGDDHWQIFLHWAAFQGHAIVVKLLLDDYGTQVDAKNGTDHIFLSCTSSLGAVKVMQLLKRDAEGTGNYTPLHRAAFRGRLDVVKLLIDQGANVDAKTNSNQTPLHWAALQGHVDVVEWLLKHNSEVNPRNKGNQTPLHQAASRGHVDVVEWLLKHNSEVNPRDEGNYTPLHRAAVGGRLDVVKLLLEHNSEIDPRDKNGCTPLYWAVLAKHADIVSLLLRNGADIEAQNSKGETPLQCVVQGGNLDIVTRLLWAGARSIFGEQDVLARMPKTREVRQKIIAKVRELPDYGGFTPEECRQFLHAGCLIAYFGQTLAEDINNPFAQYNKCAAIRTMQESSDNFVKACDQSEEACDQPVKDSNIFVNHSKKFVQHMVEVLPKVSVLPVELLIEIFNISIYMMLVEVLTHAPYNLESGFCNYLMKRWAPEHTEFILNHFALRLPKARELSEEEATASIGPSP